MLVDIVADLRELEVDLLVREALFAQPMERAQGALVMAVFYQPSGSGKMSVSKGKEVGLVWTTLIYAGRYLDE